MSKRADSRKWSPRRARASTNPINPESLNPNTLCAEAAARAAEEGKVTRPVPFLVMQPNGTDVACAYVVDEEDIDKAKAQAAAAPAAAPGSIGAPGKR